MSERNQALEGAAGVYSVTCRPIGRTYVGSTTHLRHTLREHRERLLAGCHPNLDMQADWDAYGASAFDFAIHDELPAEPGHAEPGQGDRRRELDALRDLWCDQLGLDEGRSY